MALRMRPVRKLTKLSLSRAETPILSEEEEVKRLEEMVFRKRKRFQARRKKGLA